MALAIVQELLQNYLQSLFEEGVVSNNFCQIATQSNSEVVVEQIRDYCDDIESLLSNAKECLGYNDSKFFEFVKHAKNIEKKSGRFGAELVRIASSQLVRAWQDQNTERLSQGLSWVKTEYSYTKDKLDAFIQMERKINRLKNKHRLHSK